MTQELILMLTLKLDYLLNFYQTNLQLAGMERYDIASTSSAIQVITKLYWA